MLNCYADVGFVITKTTIVYYHSPIVTITIGYSRGNYYLLNPYHTVKSQFYLCIYQEFIHINRVQNGVKCVNNTLLNVSLYCGVYER